MTTTEVPGGAALLELLDQLLAAPTVLDGAAGAARGRWVHGLPRDEVRRHIEAFLGVIRASVTGDEAQLRQAYAAADDLAADRVEQGIDLQQLLDGVSSARAVLLEGLVAGGRARFDADTLLDLLPLLDRAASGTQDHMVLAYREAERQRGRTARSRRSDALRQVLAGEGEPWVSEAGLDPARTYRVLVADVVVPAHARALEQSLDSAEGASVLLHGALCAVRPDLPAPASDLLVVHTPPVPTTELHVAYVHALRTLELLRARGATGFHSLLDHALELALAGAPWLGRQVADALLAGFDREDERQAVLVETALAHLTTGGRLEATAERLHVHPNTVKYRLRRFEELRTPVPGGREVELPPRATLWWALTAWSGPEAQPRSEKRPDKRPA